MEERRDVRLAELTTLRLGGPARRLVEVGDTGEAIEVLREADARDEPTLIVAGGSNLLVADDGFDGTVLRVATAGVSRRAEGDRVHLSVAAGESWDALVAQCVADGLAGIECLSGIPGSVGATPIQNVGAYGEEVAATITLVRAFDRRRGEIVELTPNECRFAYRSSALKHSDRHLVLEVCFALRRSALGEPVRYAELARRLGVEPGRSVPLAEVRAAVLDLRRSKGMVIDPDDPDSVSAGSFFTNPILPPARYAALEARVAERLGDGVRPPHWSTEDGRVKTSAAWLIEQAGFDRGYGDGAVGISSKHALALVNRGGGTTAELVALARELRDGVRAAFGVTLRPEPALVGVEL